jgi:anti-sigma B factor antagonist
VRLESSLRLDEGVMNSENFDLTVVDFGDVHIVSLSGELDIASADGLTDRLVEIAGSTVVVDLANLSFMDSSGIGALIRARQRMAVDGDSLLLSRPQPNVFRVLEITGLADWVSPWSHDWPGPADPR